MERRNLLRKVTKYAWDFILFKLKLAPPPVVENVPGINKAMYQNLAMNIWIETYVSLSNWRDFTYQNYLRMNVSNKLYATYVIYACHIETKCCPDPCEAFVRLTALVIQMALYSSEDQQVELLEYSCEIWIRFFESELQREFNAKGGWKKLHNYLHQRQAIELFQSLEKLESEMKFPQQIVLELELASAIPNPISEHLSQGITMTDVESHQPTMSILKSIDRILEKIKLKYSSPKHDSAESKSGRKLTCDSASAGPRGKIKGRKHFTDVFEQTEKVPPIQRVTTRQTYLRAKKMLQILQSEFMKLDEMIEFAYR